MKGQNNLVRPCENFLSYRLYIPLALLFYNVIFKFCENIMPEYTIIIQLDEIAQLQHKVWLVISKSLPSVNVIKKQYTVHK